MTAEDFKKAISGIAPAELVGKMNALYSDVSEKYIKDNSPHKVGDKLIIKDVGSRGDLVFHKKRFRMFRVDTLEVALTTIGDPLIMMGGVIIHTRAKNVESEVGTYKCVVHGSMSAVTFDEYKQAYSK